MESRETILDRIARRVVLWDGAMATMLFRAGLDPRTPPELWNGERPEVVAHIHAAYYAAGSDVVQTNTFGTPRLRAGRAPDTEAIYRMSRAAADLARRVCPPDRFVAGNLGPTGLFTSPAAAAPGAAADAEPVFRAAAEGLRAGGVDLVSIETMTGLSEALIALRAARSLGSWPVAVSMTFRRTPAGFHSFWNEPAAHCAQALIEAGADLIGANCMDGADLIELTELLSTGLSRPLLIQPNAGSPAWRDGQYVYPHRAPDLVRAALAARAAGARALGGCCGTTPEFIRWLRQALDEPSSVDRITV